MIDQTSTTSPIDLRRAQFDPGSVFASPRDVVHFAGLSRRQKIHALRDWEYEATQHAVALQEGMRGSEDDLQRQVLLALHELQADAHVDRISLNKHYAPLW